MYGSTNITSFSTSDILNEWEYTNNICDMLHTKEIITRKENKKWHGAYLNNIKKDAAGCTLLTTPAVSKVLNG